MNEKIAKRRIHALYYEEYRPQAFSVIVVNREDEPFDYVSESARWFYQTLKGVYMPHKKLLNCQDFEYWFRITARESAAKPLWSDFCWSTAPSMSLDFALSKELQIDATLWYHYLKGLVAVGRDYPKARKLSIDEFLDMDEDKAMEWANRDCPKIVGTVYSAFEERLQERIL